MLERRAQAGVCASHPQDCALREAPQVSLVPALWVSSQDRPMEKSFWASVSSPMASSILSWHASPRLVFRSLLKLQLIYSCLLLWSLLLILLPLVRGETVHISLVSLEAFGPLWNLVPCVALWPCLFDEVNGKDGFVDYLLFLILRMAVTLSCIFLLLLTSRTLRHLQALNLCCNWRQTKALIAVKIH